MCEVEGSKIQGIRGGEGIGVEWGRGRDGKEKWTQVRVD